ncbi:MAG: hypothetical protein KatS3mg076_0919 [Candidatus Binatia bacterium]|nr:MAG: hypothetical protein KatS3mg076_0919 [Candidatus Binatia bacterium]
MTRGVRPSGALTVPSSLLKHKRPDQRCVPRLPCTPPLWRRAVRSRALHVFLLLFGFGFLFVKFLGSQERLEAFRSELGLLAPILTIPVHAVVAISPFPSEVIAFANGIVYGFWRGALLSWLGWMAAAFLHYGLVRWLASDLDVRGWLERAPAWLRRFPAHHPVFLIAGRWVPYGPQLVCTVAGAYGVPFVRFAWCTGVSIVPVAFFFATLATGVS